MRRLAHVRHLLGAFAVIMFTGIPVPGQTQSLLERLVAPGELVVAHEKLEGGCDACHAPFEQGGQSGLCKGCHKKVAADISSAQGFHGRNPAVRGAECSHCHTDHIGRDADIVRLNPATFDHTRTDFALAGRHATAECAGCHKPGKKHREAPGACIDCHRPDDAHAGRLGTDCGSCHKPEGWREAADSFDHQKTRFPLEGKHREVRCKNCHIGETYKQTPTDCIGCHRLQDEHDGGFGAKCESCHVPRKWTTIRFDHDRDTKFRLTGAHRQTDCDGCHIDNPYKEKTGQLCTDCHRPDDVHNGLNGRDCASCHDTRDWTASSFDHSKTKFALRGAHAEAPCASCHAKPATEVKLPLDCHSCHARDDVHHGRLGPRCADCHQETRWNAVRFDHSRTRFPLKGAHAGAKCDACHTGPATEVKLSTKCYACHAGDDTHKGGLGRDCGRCHDEKRWRQDVFFDHGLTAFPLIGLHAAVPCEECHASQNFKETSARCVDCHRDKDVHKGALGADCGACHNPNAWSRWIFDHAQTGFALTGGHSEVACEDCHREGTQKPVSARCVACHRKDDVHRGGFSTRCERCHGAEDWGQVK